MKTDAQNHQDHCCLGFDYMTLWVWAHTGDLTLTLEDRMPPTSSYILLKTVSGFWEILTSHRELRTARTSGLARWWTVVSATTSASTQLAKAAVLGEEPQNWLQQKICFFRVFQGFSGFHHIALTSKWQVSQGATWMVSSCFISPLRSRQQRVQITDDAKPDWSRSNWSSVPSLQLRRGFGECLETADRLVSP
jgi:hypothetical protein